MRRHAQLALGGAISLVCLGLAVWGLEPDEVWHALAGARYGWLLPAWREGGLRWMTRVSQPTGQPA